MSHCSCSWRRWRSSFASRLPRATVVVTACGDDRGLRDTLERLRPQGDRVDAELLLIFNTWPDDISRGDRDELEGKCCTRLRRRSTLNNSVAYLILARFINEG